MKEFIKRTVSLFVASLMLFTMLQFPIIAEDGDGETPEYTVEQVIQLLEQIDSLQEMQDKRKTEFAATKRAITSANFASNIFDEEALEEHELLAAAYEAYVADMFEKRAEAKAAYDSLTPDQQAEISADLSGKLDPYEQLDTYFNQRAYNILEPESENSPYIYQLIGAYECSNHGCGEIPATMALINVTDESIRNENGQWVPDKLYEYGECNYDIVYCSDAHPSPSTTNLYKRINLEDSTYYSKAAARKLRAIVINSYPYVSIDEMKAFLKANGFDSEKADKLDRSEIIAGVQMAIWYFANTNNSDHEDLVGYQYTFNNYKNPWMPNRIHQFQNECWTWWDAAGNGQFSAWRPYKTYLNDIADRINSLVSFLVSLPGQGPAEDQTIISDIQITRRQLVPGSDDTYTVGLKVILNNGRKASVDSVELVADTFQEGEAPARVATVDLSELTEYEFEVTAKDGDTIQIAAEGKQHLGKGVYCYETAAGSRADQALISVSEGETRVRAQASIKFKREGDIGLRISKVARGEEHEYPISDIDFKVYAVPDTVEPEGEVPTPEEIEIIAVPENLAGSLTTDNSGYAFVDLPYGTYMLVEQPSDKVIAPSDPIYFVLPTVKTDGDIVIVTDIAEIVVENTREDFETAAVELDAYKHFDDWGKADSFRFRLDPVTEGAPMPINNIAVATSAKPLAVFEKITYDDSCFDTGDPDSNVRTYKYTITEINDHVPGVTYDTTAYPVTVTVTKNIRIDTEQNIRIIEITAVVDYDGADSIVITNTFTATHAHFEATKGFDDWGKADSFTFVLAAVTDGAPMPATTSLTVTEADPTAVFAELEYDKVGVYEYTITEVDDHVPGVTYDTTPHLVTVTVTANAQTNALSAAVKYDGADALVITNTFNAAQAHFEATKQFDDWGKADSFTFVLAAVTEGAPMPATTSLTVTEADPTAVFAELEYDTVGVYEYTITEVDDHVPGVTYDTTAHLVTVTVTADPDTNALSAVVKYDGDDALVITNTFTATHAHFEATKQFDDWGKADSFTFVLAAVTEGAPMPTLTSLTVTEADPTAVFAELEFDKVGVYEYTITEVNDHVPGVTYDTTAHKVTVTVTADPDTNALSAVVEYDGADALVITNTFTATHAHFEATKQFDDWGKADSFTFVLAAVTDGAPMPTTASLTVTEADPTAVFAELEFDKVGVYKYTITEVDDHVPGVTYDTTAHAVTVTVAADPDTNELSATVDYGGKDSLVITNTFTATYAHFEATKQFADWGKANSFTFVLAAVTNGAPMPLVSELIVTESAPTAVFAELEFDKVGVYKYTITEVDDHVPGVTYDTTAHTVTVTVTADPDTNALSAVVVYDDAAALIITNTFTATHAHFEATKQFNDWGKADSFTFVLAAVTDGAPMPATTSLTVTKNAPTAVFAELEYDKVGVYEYTITEVNDHVPGVTYDTAAHKVTVTVTADPDTNVLSAVLDYDGADALVITNTFTATHAHFEATKQFNDWGKANSFTFVLAAVTEGAPMPALTSLTVTKDAKTAVFAKLEYDKVGVYEYTITEVNDHVPGVTYDTTAHIITVTVTADPDTNELSAVVDYDGADALVITNTFTATHAHFEAIKQFADWGKADSFTFVLAAITEGAPMPAVTSLTVTKDAKTAVFAELEYDKVGVYEYTITEVNDHVPGVTYDTAAHKVTVTVTADPDTNALSATVDYDGADALVITNTFTATHAHFEATKQFNDWGKADSFTFVLAAVTNGAPMPLVSELIVTESAPTAVFAELEFDTVGIYEYTITEVNDHVPGVTYDTAAHKVTVTVTADPDTNALSAAVDYDGTDALIITNTFTATHAHFEATKQFADWGKANSFTFVLAAVTDGAPMPTIASLKVTKDAPTAVFAELEYDKVGVYEYTITEVNEYVPGVTYDTTAHKVTVTVTADPDTNALSAVVKYDGSDALIITNTFTATHAHFEATKQFDDWGKADSFTFVLAAVTDDAPMPTAASLTVTKDAKTAVFAELEYDKVGVYEYTITEVNDHVPGVTYDTAAHKVTVTVTADPDTNALSAVVDYDGADALVITNTFTATHAHFEATKQFADWGKADSFKFVLAAITDGAPMPAVTELKVTESAPTAVFAELVFDTVGVYKYTITELDDHVPGVTYDTTAHPVTVTVSADAQTNALSAVVDYGGKDTLVITNSFNATYVHFEATKQFSDWGKAGSFTFVLAAVTEGAPMPLVSQLTVTENVPVAVFAELEFDKVGVYEYTITEVNDHVPGVTYDTTAHKVIVTVTADPDTNVLSAVVDYDGAAALVITNTFTATHAHFEATKQFADWGKADSFTFVLAAVTEGAPMPTAVSLTVTKDAPTAVFAELEYDKVGVYEYTITEVNDHVPGVTYDTTAHIVIVTVTADPDTNVLSAVVDYDGAAALVITNTFTATHAHFEATKQFNDWGKADSFTFVLAAVTDGAPMPTAASLTVTKDAPTAVFAELDYDKVGVYEYTITEINDGMPGVTYDTTAHKVTVTVTADPDTNALSAVVDYDGSDALIITNTFTATHAHFEATKQFNDWGKADAFTFVLAAVTEGAPMPTAASLTVTKDAPTAVFAELEFDTVGTYEYTITEVNDHVPGVTYDTAAHKVTVTVTADPDTNALSAVVDYDGADVLVITNTFTATNSHFEATKQFEDWGKADAFTFVLAAVTEGAPMPALTELTVTENAPTAVFAELEFDTVGVYKYTITEVNDGVPGVTYDTAAHVITVTVTADAQTNALSAVVDYGGKDALVITNSFTATYAHFEATKQFSDWGKADAFTFVLAAITEGAPMPAVTELTVTENAPTAVFAELEFDTIGVFEYTITEVNDGVPGVTYDTAAHKVIVTVTADPETNLLSSVVDYDGSDALIITNSYATTPCSAAPEVTKELTGRAWEDNDEFIFDIAAVTENAPMPKVTTASATKANPTAIFESIEFTEPGVYVYTITERAGDIVYMTYDTTPHIVTITVTDVDSKLVAEIDYEGSSALSVTNSLCPPPPPTGDESAFGSTAALLLLIAAGAVLFTLRRRRNSEV